MESNRWAVRLASLVTTAATTVTTATLDAVSGRTLSYGDAGTFDTASIVEVDILAALPWKHQQDGTTHRPDRNRRPHRRRGPGRRGDLSLPPPWA